MGDTHTETVREHLIVTAVNFLTNPSVKSSSLHQKQSFLRNKGLTEDEIQLACERAGLFSGSGDNHRHLNGGSTIPTDAIISLDQPTRGHSSRFWTTQALTTFGKIKEMFSSLAFVSGIAYAIYLFYKRYIEPFLFGGGDGSKKKKSIDEKLDDLTVKVDTDMRALGLEVTRVKDELERNAPVDALKREMQGFKSDLEAIKGLLLNKKQFASPNLPVVPPSIPSWQLQARHDSHEEDKNDEDAGSGSGSSETEVVTKNSDSSLEIM